MFYGEFLRSVRNEEDEEEEEKNEEIKTNFVRSYLGNGWSDFLHIWYVDYPNWAARLQQFWFQSDKGSQSYIGVKIAFSFFLLIYSRCGAPASWAARHTIVCLDIAITITRQYSKLKGVAFQYTLYSDLCTGSK